MTPIAPNITGPAALGLLALALTCALAACGREEPPATQPVTAPSIDNRKSAIGNRQTAAAAPDHYLSATAPAALVAVAPAPKPAGPTFGGCVTPACHTAFKTAAHVHGPVSSNACDMCHQSDCGNHSFPLKRQGNALCEYCHSVTGRAQHVHAAIGDAGCTACHNPHASQTNFLLTAASTRDLCLRCHVLPQQLHAHGPVADGQCTDCHQPHESNFRGLLRGGDGPDHCFLCHSEMKQHLASATVTHDLAATGPLGHPATSSCLTCHTPHYSDHDHQLQANVHDLCVACHAHFGPAIQQATVPHTAASQGDACANCHDTHGTNTAALLRQRQDNLCLNCHNQPLTTPSGRVVPDMTAQFVGRRFPHGPVANGDCAGCHQAHGSANANLLSKPFPQTFYAPFELDAYGLCFTCHNRDIVLQPTTTALTGFRDGDRNLHYLHVNRPEKGRTCRTCHEIHASDLPKHMAASVPFEGGSWAMPINYQITAEGGSCAPACHAPKTYHRRPAVPLAARPATQPATGGDS